ncbi:MULTISPECIES: hypothetical protein [Erwinia]|jgi:hypothetical protein|uniref:Uncharacterized protein n=2 Tax=Erwinia TaxID=551 RepID=A0ABV4EE74_9GAMM|nr:hypothetical protein [Erwinia sp. PsM31]MDN4629017.1 hypothetical protein [Erwinia sp. PsM31]
MYISGHKHTHNQPPVSDSPSSNTSADESRLTAGAASARDSEPPTEPSSEAKQHGHHPEADKGISGNRKLLVGYKDALSRSMVEGDKKHLARFDNNLRPPSVLLPRAASSPDVIHDSDVLNDFRRQASERGRRYGASAKTVGKNQEAWIDKKTGKGILSGTLWPHDEAVWNTIPDIKNQPSAVFMPGYAVGDRYSAILTMLTYPEMKLTIGYSEKQPVLPAEKKYAMEAFEIITDALKKSGVSQENINKRLSVVRYDGETPLNHISGSFNDPENRKNFTTVLGEKSAICEPQNASPDSHLFHISATTVMMAKHWEDNDDPVRSGAEIRKLVYGLVNEEARAELDSLVDSTIKETGLKDNSVLLWKTNKPFETPVRDAASARQKEAFANPRMFELIHAALEKQGTPVAYIGDGFRNEYKNRIEDRHPWENRSTPDLSKFWQKSALLKERVNQWYFLDRIMQKSNGKAFIGVRSGALEPLSLLGHNVVYLEPKSLFTPERHAPWQGRIPYNRLITEASAGYIDNDTEVELKNLGKEIVADNLRAKLSLGPGDGDRQALVKSLSENNLAGREKIDRHDRIENNIAQGILSPAELSLMLRMVETGQPAHLLMDSEKSG